MSISTRTALPATLLLACLAGATWGQQQVLTSNHTFSIQNQNTFWHNSGSTQPASVSWQMPVPYLNKTWEDKDILDWSGAVPGVISGFISGHQRAGRMGLDLSATASGAKIDLSVPTSITYRAPTQIAPGQRVTISSSRTVSNGMRFDSQAAQLQASLDLVFKGEWTVGFGAHATFRDPWTTGEQESSIPRNVPQSMLDRHRRDVTLLSTYGQPNNEIRKSLISVGVGSTGVTYPIPRSRGVVNLTALPNPAPGIHGGTRTGDTIRGSSRSVDPWFGGEVNVTNLWNNVLTKAYPALPPLGFSIPDDPDASTSLSGYLADWRFRAGLYAKQEFEFGVDRPEAMGVLYYDQNGTLLGSGNLGGDFSFVAPQDLSNFHITAKAFMRDPEMRSRFGFDLGVDTDLRVLGGTVKVWGRDLVSFGPLARGTWDLGHTDPYWLFNSTVKLDADPAHWGIAQQRIDFSFVPAPGAVALFGLGMLGAARRRR